MFYNTHAYFASKLYESDEPLLIVGSFLPDIAITNIIDWERGLHDKEIVGGLLEFIKKSEPSYVDLYKGIYSHYILDDFTHHKYKTKPGYAFQNNKELVEITMDFYDLDKAPAQKLAHNFIESGVEKVLLPAIPDIPRKIKTTLQQINIIELGDLLSSFFHIEKAKFQKAMSSYFNLIQRYDFKEKESWVLFWNELNKMKSLKEVDSLKITKLLDVSVDLVKDTYQDFLKYALQEGKKQI